MTLHRVQHIVASNSEGRLERGFTVSSAFLQRNEQVHISPGGSNTMHAPDQMYRRYVADILSRFKLLTHKIICTINKYIRYGFFAWLLVVGMEFGMMSCDHMTWLDVK